MGIGIADTAVVPMHTSTLMYLRRFLYSLLLMISGSSPLNPFLQRLNFENHFLSLDFAILCVLSRVRGWDLVSEAQLGESS
jgi:hypothetical protein